MPQDETACGNYPYNMAATLPSSSEEPAGGSAGMGIDWSATLAAHNRWLRTVVRTRLGEPQAVDDVMQAVALAAVAQRAPLNDLARVGAWLYRLAIRQTLLYRRRCGRQRRLLDGFASAQTARGESSPGRDPLDLLLADERRVLVRQALARLPRRDTEILLLKYTEDWSYRELATHLGISESAVEARLHRARQRLRDTMIGPHRNEETP